MQPYQRSGKEREKKSAQPMNLLKEGGKLGLQTATALGGATIMAKALPFLAEGITAETAIRGLSSISPKFGKFINDALKMGKNFDEIKSFMGEQLSTAEQAAPKSLFDRLVGDIDIASLDEGMQKQLQFLMPISKKLEEQGKDEKDSSVKRLKEKISKILKGKVGFLAKQAMELDPSAQPMQAPQQTPMQGQMGQPQQPQQGGPGQAALMQILQQIQATRGMGG